jgi:peptide/nickel transport system substrate-binding protein
MTLRIDKNIVQFDPYQGEQTATVETAWLERLTADDWTLDPSIFDYKTQFRPSQFTTGHLAETWEMPDPSTYIVHLRKGIQWQNIFPVNGREFVASDVVAHYQRLYGAGVGKPAPYYAAVAAFQSLTSVTATDKYTVVFKWTLTNPEAITESLQAIAGAGMEIEAPDAVKQWGDVTDWHHAIGTGPFILQDFVDGSSATLIKNPTYWGYDERYPKNKLPYVDFLKILIIPDPATALAALRSGKIDAMGNMSIAQSQSIKKTNPEILQLGIPSATAPCLDPRQDVKPYSDIRVREALQMAINLPDLAQNYYSGTCTPEPSTLTSRYMSGWGFPYSQWPQTLKDEYSYNPAAAKKLLADAGYPNGFNTDIVVDNACDLDLLQVVKSYFAAINVNMEIRPVDSATFATFVRANHQQDALAERSASSLSFNYEPIMSLTKFNSTGASNWLMIRDPVFDAFYTQALAGTSVDDVKAAVKGANQYVAQHHFAISLVLPNTFTLVQPWLKGYNGQDDALFGTTCPRMLFFYPARFWIDQQVKKSLGH